MRPFSVDVVILTKARPRLLIRTLRSLFAGTTPAGLQLRILIGINGPDPRSERILKAVRNRRPETLFTRLPAPQKLGQARQTVIETFPGTSEWLCFLDDDVEVPSDYFLAFAGRRQSADLIGGPNLTPLRSSCFEKMSGDALAHWWGAGPFRDRYRRGNARSVSDDRALILCNLFVRRDLFERLRFPPHLHGGEENDLIRRASNAGARLLYAPELFLFHRRRPSPRSFLAQIRGYGRGRGEILRDSRWPWRWLGLTALVAFAAISIASPRTTSLLILFHLLLSAAVALRETWKTRDARYMALAPLIPSLHAAYAGGVLWGLFSRSSR